jgi:acetate---CoA ligase (ADP-forming)
VTLGARSRLEPLFAPRGIAVVGASRDPGKLGAVMLRSLRPFGGPVAGVNPRDADPGARQYASVAEAAAATDARLDLAVLCVPAAAAAQAVTDAARAGLVLLGPNTSGFLVPALRLSASFVPGAASVPAGPVAVVAASGGVNHALAYLLAEAGVGVSLAVGLGNAVDVTAADVLRHLAADGRTRAVALHVESVPDGPALVGAVRYLAERKPVAALVVGRCDVADFARSHTGTLATSWRTTRAALRQAGAVVVDDERDLVDAVTALSSLRLPPRTSSGVGVVTAQAGPGLLHVDGLRARGVEVPPLAAPTRRRLAALLPPLTYQANPVDTGRPGPAFGEVLAAVAADPGVDLVSVYALTEPDTLDLPAALAQVNAPVVTALGGPAAEVAAQREALRRMGVPVLASPRALTTAVTALVEDAHARAAPAGPAVSVDLSVGSGPFDEDQAKTVLGALGIATPPRRACTTRAQGHEALAALGGTVAVKLLDAGITHKSDVGGVFLGVRDVAGLEAALDALEAAGHHRYLVEAMAPPGVDLLAGARRDPVFGPVMLLGLGGVVAEALADVAVALAPLSEAGAAGLADRLAGRALLDGFRGGPVADRAALGAVLARLGALLAANPGVEEIEINPLRITREGLVALDAVLRTRDD